MQLEIVKPVEDAEGARSQGRSSIVKSSWELGIKWKTSNNGVKSHREADWSHLKGQMENRHWAPNLILVKNIHSVFLSQNTRLGHKKAWVALHESKAKISGIQMDTNGNGGGRYYQRD